MGNSTNDIPKGLKIGSRLVFIAGLFPLMAATYLFVTFVWSVSHPDNLWIPSGFKVAPYTLNQVKAVPDNAVPGQTVPDFGPALGSNIVDVTWMGSVNGMISGVSIVVLAIFGLRKRLKFAWYQVLFIALWGAGNDTISTIVSGQFPVPIFPLVLGLTGLWICRPYIFGNQE
jgi:hypothetical protein